MNWQHLAVTRVGPVGVITLNRPTALNALSTAVARELGAALDDLERDHGIKVLVLTGGEQVFAAGADIPEMIDKSQWAAFAEEFTGCCERLANCRKPVVAAVAGYALGGGCELVEMCDIVIAAESAKFGHPEIKLATMPGAGGTQRLPRAVGKHRAMDLLLTGRILDAREAERAGLVSRIAADATLLRDAMSIAAHIAQYSALTLMMVKEAVNFAFRSSLSDGLLLERRLFHMTFGTEDRLEAMRAFAEKRPHTVHDR